MLAVDWLWQNSYCYCLCLCVCGASIMRLRCVCHTSRLQQISCLQETGYSGVIGFSRLVVCSRQFAAELWLRYRRGDVSSGAMQRHGDASSGGIQPATPGQQRRRSKGRRRQRRKGGDGRDKREATAETKGRRRQRRKGKGVYNLVVTVQRCL